MAIVYFVSGGANNTLRHLTCSDNHPYRLFRTGNGLTQSVHLSVVKSMSQRDLPKQERTRQETALQSG
jgi:hypothetical protein